MKNTASIIRPVAWDVYTSDINIGIPAFRVAVIDDGAGAYVQIEDPAASGHVAANPNEVDVLVEAIRLAQGAAFLNMGNTSIGDQKPNEFAQGNNSHFLLRSEVGVKDGWRLLETHEIQALEKVTQTDAVEQWQPTSRSWGQPNTALSINNSYRTRLTGEEFALRFGAPTSSPTQTRDEDTITETNPCAVTEPTHPPVHNPHVLTAEQVGTVMGWRLLDEDEIVPRPVSDFIQFWSVDGRWYGGANGSDHSKTYRTRLSREQLASGGNGGNPSPYRFPGPKDYPGVIAEYSTTPTPEGETFNAAQTS